MRLLLLLAVVVELLFSQKVALLIGNGNYQYQPLKNPKNDSDDIAELLRKKGFIVEKNHNLSKSRFDEVALTFWSKYRKSDIALFYYAGHGVEYRSESYLLPTDNLFFYNLRNEILIPKKSIKLREIQEAMDRAKNGFNLLIVDACRDSAIDKRTRSVLISSDSGIATPRTSGLQKPTLIAYATEAGGTAPDGDGRNGTYTKHLLKEMERPHQDLVELFNRVARKVKAETGRVQKPKVYGDIDEADFSFTEKEKKFSLTINTTPKDAQIELGNGLFFYNGIRLKEGRYYIKISHSGYKSVEGDFDLEKDTVINLELNKISPQGRNSPKPTTSTKMERSPNWHIPLIEWSDKYGLGLPRTKEALQKITEIEYSDCCKSDNQRMDYIPESIGNLSNLQKLDLDKNPDLDFNKAFYILAKNRNLKTLYLGGNKLIELPESIGNLHNLKELSLRGNKLTRLPEWIGNLKNLQILWLYNNKLTGLPSSIGKLYNLQTLYLGGNNLTEIPESIGKLSNLKELYLRGNNFSDSEKRKIEKLLLNCKVEF